MDGLMMRYELTLAHVLGRMGRYFSETRVLSRGSDGAVVETTFGEVHRRSRRLASALLDLGVGPGDRVATLGWNHGRHLEAYFGIPLSGGVLHTLNPRLASRDLAYIASAARDRFVLVDEDLLPVLDSFRGEVGLERVVVWGSGGRVPAGYLDYEELLEAGRDDEPSPLEEDRAASMCYTSATTGRPKGVVYSHRALVLHSIVSAMPDMFDISMHDIVMPVVPMFHVNAWGLPFTASLVGASLVLPGPRLDPENLLDLIVGQRVSFAAGVPTVWLRVLETLEANPGAYDLESLRTVLIGGSAAPPALIQAFERYGVRVLHAWGMTETTPLGSVSRLKPSLVTLPEHERLRYRAMQGLPAPLVELRAMGGSGPITWDGETLGELEARGPWIASGYYGHGDHTDRFTGDGWFRTGDIVAVDPQGYIRIADRVSDLIKSGGEWISSVELENALMEHESVQEAAVVAVPHPVWVERPVAAVVLRPGASATAEELRSSLRERFVSWWVPDDVVFLEEIPKTAVGKFSKKDLRKMLEGHVPDSEPNGPPQRSE